MLHRAPAEAAGRKAAKMQTSTPWPLPTHMTKGGQRFKLWMEQVLDEPDRDHWLYRLIVEHIDPPGTPDDERWGAAKLLVHVKKAAYPTKSQATQLLQGDVLTQVVARLESATKEAVWPLSFPDMQADWWMVP